MMRFSALVLNRMHCLPTRICLLLVALAGLLRPANATTTVTYSTSGASQNFGTVNIGSSSLAVLSFNVSGGAIGSVEVVTQGAPHLDFTDAGGGSCTSGTSSACTVDVNFKPNYAGLRRGAVLFWSGAGNTGSIIGKTLIYGVGNGGQVVYLPPVISSVAAPSNLSPTSWNFPAGVALDGTGDLYVVDGTNMRVVELPVTGTATLANSGTTLQYPNKAIVDGAGDLFIADTDGGRLVEVPVGGGAPLGITATVNGQGMVTPYGLDVDGVGNIYVVDAAVYRVIKITSIAANGTATASLVSLGGYSILWGTDAWLDAAGDLFVSDFGFDINSNNVTLPTNPQVLEVHAGTGAVTQFASKSSACPLDGPWSAEADAAGNMFIGDEDPTGVVGGYEQFSGRMIEISAGGGCTVTNSLLGVALGAGGAGIGEINLSASGDIYIADLGGNRVIKEQRSVVPTVNFGHTTLVGNVDTTDGTRTVQISNIGNLTLDFSGLSYPADFAAGSASGQCTSSSTVAINGSCNVAIEFYPQNSGSLSENVVLTNNANGGSQSITVTGLANGPPSITSGSSATFTVGSSGTFTVTTNGYPKPGMSKSGTLPNGVSFTDNGNGTATISGTPSAATGGAYTFNITAANGLSPNAVQTFTLTVDQAPSITNANSTTFTVGSNGSFQMTASGYPAPTFSLAGALPNGVTMTTSGLLSGTPAAGTGGSYPVSITALNGASPNATQSFTLTVDQAPAFTSANNATFTVGQLGSFQMAASGYPTSMSWSASGALPSGETLTSSGLLSGTPAAGTGGTYPITVTASNGVGTNATQNFTLTVDQAPAFTSANNTTFTVGQLGSFNVTASGFPAPTFSLAGALPNGVTMTTSGLLSGTPAAGTGGSYPFTITAMNGTSPNATQSFTLTVSTPPTPFILSPAAGTPLGGPTVFIWSPGTGVSKLQLYIGTTGVGSHNLYQGPDLPATTTSSSAINIPSNGATLYVRLWYLVGSAWQSVDYTWAEVSPPAITSPAAGTPLAGPTTFTWTPSSSSTGFQLYIGTTGVGSHDLYQGPDLSGSSTSSSAVTIPGNGATLYVRLWFMANGTWQSVDSTYTEAAPPSITSPSASTLVGGGTVFMWNPGTGTTQFQVYVGTTGIGSSNLYRGPDLAGTATSSASINIPLNGDTLYVRLWYARGASWQSVDYTWTEATPPSISTPTSGSTIGGPTTFSWNPGTGATSFQLYVGTTGAGSSDVYRGPDLSGSTTSSASITIPTNGAGLYVRLWYLVNGAWQHLDYSYTEQ